MDTMTLFGTGLAALVLAVLLFKRGRRDADQRDGAFFESDGDHSHGGSDGGSDGGGGGDGGGD